MYFCYPKQSNKTVAGIIAMLACRQLFPLTALQLSHMLHVVADDKSQSRLSNSGCIRPGSTVELQNIDTGECGWLQLVNPAHADYHKGRISLLSPLGCALPGKTADNEFSLQLLGCRLRFRVLTVLNVKHSITHSITHGE
ncbi:GreA/GreB family elongation factor [Rheinheimera sp.]|uniref:GreA/GreB family elongation factor n=1 Tax=Rheinheimera sp. TaxID=1869214 RepID=UPI0027365CA3|nr:GreA/GreB family elongation factor [Rheinheimera sp.]MDP2713783.1 GreA/GreB family elongation factor [Rheinheimera sp.]